MQIIETTERVLARHGCLPEQRKSDFWDSLPRVNVGVGKPMSRVAFERAGALTFFFLLMVLLGVAVRW